MFKVTKVSTNDTERLENMGEPHVKTKTPTLTKTTTHTARLLQAQPDVTIYNAEKSQAAQQRKLMKRCHNKKSHNPRTAKIAERRDS